MSRALVLAGCIGALATGLAIGATLGKAAAAAQLQRLVPSADQLSASLRAAKGQPPRKLACPSEMARVGNSCVDRYEARLLKVEADGSLVPNEGYARPGPGKYVAESRAGVRPQGYVSRVEAADACENAGKRLCTASEWYLACAGNARETYPYGADYETGRCNVGKPHLLSILHGTDPHAWSYANFNDPELDRRPGFLALTGEYGTCSSPEGVLDLVGNLHEWVADAVDPSLAEKLPVPAVLERRIGKRSGNGIFMGGFFSTMNEHGPGCTFTTAAHEPGYHDYSTGFRCCRNSEP